MTDPIETSEPVPPLHGAIEAFLDGEIVDPSMLRTALADEAARDYFIDLLIVRGLLNGLDSVAMRAAHPPRGSQRRARWLAAAAAGAFVSLSAGYLAGQRAVAGATAPSTVEAVVIPDGEPAAPEPTRSITLKPGLNWTDSSGGR